jgi:RNA polymerase sigma factor (TIGR02999 family)
MLGEPPTPADASDGPADAGDGARGRADGQLFASLYAELRRLADRELRRHAGSSVSPTTLVHEVYVNLADREPRSFPDKARFLAYAARAMRGLIIDFARNRQTLKRGAGFHITQLSTQIGEAVADGPELSRLSDALDQLAAVDPRLAEVVDLKYFCGFSFAEIAALRGTSERTVQRDWEKARLVLYREFTDIPAG